MIIVYLQNVKDIEFYNENLTMFCIYWVICTNIIHFLDFKTFIFEYVLVVLKKKHLTSVLVINILIDIDHYLSEH